MLTLEKKDLKYVTKFPSEETGGEKMCKLKLKQEKERNDNKDQSINQ